MTTAILENSKKATKRPEPSPEELEPFMGMTKEKLSELVLGLLLRDAVEARLSAFLPFAQNLTPEPVEG